MKITPSPITIRRATLRAVAALTVLGVGSGAFAANAGAAVPERYPLGSIHTLGRTSIDTARITGRAADPDRQTLAVLVQFTVDGRHVATVSANEGGDGHVFDASLRIDAGAHRVCTSALGRGPKQLKAELGCANVGAYAPPAPAPAPAPKPTPKPAPGTPAGGTAERVPMGSIHTAGRTSISTARIVGRAADPDRPTVSVLVKFAVDGRHLATVSANRGADAHGYEANLTIDAKAHQICAVAVGAGPKKLTRELGCANVPAFTPPAPAPAPKPTLPCQSNVILFMPTSMRMLAPPADTCFKWARTDGPGATKPASWPWAASLRLGFDFSANWGVDRPLPHETKGRSWTFEDMIVSAPGPQPMFKEAAKWINGSPNSSSLGFLQLAVRGNVTRTIESLGVTAPFIPVVQVYRDAPGGISDPTSLGYARSLAGKGVLPVFNVSPKNLNASTIDTIRKECINFKGRIGVWTGTGSYTISDPAKTNAEIEAFKPMVWKLYQAIDACNQVVGRKSAPTASLAKAFGA